MRRGEGLTVEDLTVVLDGTVLVEDVSVSLPRGAVIGVIGPNGAGKSTLLRGLAGVLPVARGAVTWDGTDLLRLRPRQRARLLALVEQNAHTEEALTVRQVVELGRVPHQQVLRFGGASPEDATRVEEAMVTAGCAAFADRRYTTLSGGQRQRVGLARALAQEPRLLMLDEPTNHLDPHAQLSILYLLRQLAHDGLTVVTALHDLTHAAHVCDLVVVLRGGTMHAAGHPADVLVPDLIREVYDVDAHVLRHPHTLDPVFALSLPDTGAFAVDADNASATPARESAQTPRSSGNTREPNTSIHALWSAPT